eukprot:UN25238
MGTHISKVRSITLDDWNENMVSGIKTNSVVNAEYEYHVEGFKKPRADSSNEVAKKYIFAKYQDKAFIRAKHSNKGPKAPIYDTAKNTPEKGNTVGSIQYSGDFANFAQISGSSAFS